MTDFFDVVARQRAHRAFTDEAVDDTTIERLLEAAVRAPNAENRQPWQFIVVRDSKSRASLGELMARAWDRGGKQWSESRVSGALLADVDRGMHGGFAGAPVMIVVCADLTRTTDATVGSSLFPAIQNLLLAAGALGLGSALTTIATSFGAELREHFDLPETLRVVAIVPIGHPATPLGPSRRDPARDHTHRERFGTPWP